MDKKMETTIMGYIGAIQGYIGFYRDNGNESGNYDNGIYRDCKDPFLHT